MDRKTFYEVQKFKKFLMEKIGPQEVRDIHEHAMEGVARGEAYVGVGDYGCNGFVYYSETAKVYEKFETAIWAALYDATIEAGGDYVCLDECGDVIAINCLAYLADQGTIARGGSGTWNVSCAASFENMAVWWMADRVIQGIATEEFRKVVADFDSNGPVYRGVNEDGHHLSEFLELSWTTVAHKLYPMDDANFEEWKAYETFVNIRERDDVFDREWRRKIEEGVKGYRAENYS